MVVQPNLCRTWSELPKTGFLSTQLIAKAWVVWKLRKITMGLYSPRSSCLATSQHMADPDISVIWLVDHCHMTYHLQPLWGQMRFFVYTVRCGSAPQYHKFWNSLTSLQHANYMQQTLLIIWASLWENRSSGFRPGLTQTGLYSQWRWLEAWNFGLRK